MRRESFAVLCCNTGENADGPETVGRMAGGRDALGTRNGKTVNISVKRESRQFCAFQS